MGRQEGCSCWMLQLRTRYCVSHEFKLFIHRKRLINLYLLDSAEFYEHGADTTIVQRSSTYVVSSKHGLPAWLNGFYQEGGPHVDDADILFTSLPTELVGEFHKISTAQVAELDKPILDGLEAVGFKLNRYNSGLFMKVRD